MRHIVFLALQVALLALGVVGLALLCGLVANSSPFDGAFAAFFGTAIEAVAVPMITVTAQEDQASALLAGEEPKAVVGHVTILAVDKTDETGDPGVGRRAVGDGPGGPAL